MQYIPIEGDPDKIEGHDGHHLECVEYGEGDNIAIECLDCCTVLVDRNSPETDDEVNEGEYNDLASHVGHELYVLYVEVEGREICCDTCGCVVAK